ncbi:hypothetical protein H7J06_26275 [Mycobacterium hodleri]|uniref:hypothetical protein n=1 Tax=Mycolicibacterium hodleri TaxID=49897 RepID=UPI0021F31538|nr:hypothetical protein [Mycolicibacterium hodleri]MCV7136480.1 hypothetical protein [Mycolicibacterium hodleri]
MQNSSVEMETSRNDDRTTDTTLPGRVSGQEAEAIANAVERMAALGIDPNAAVYVDDENRCPSYARRIGTAWGGQELDDEELDYAIGWLPEAGFLNDDTPWPGSYNPYITLAHLRALAGD